MTNGNIPTMERPLRLLRVVHTLDGESGGPSESVRRSTEALLRLGHSVDIAVFDRHGDPASSVEMLSVRSFAAGSWLRLECSSFVSWLKENCSRYDAVLVHGLWQFQGWETHLALRNTGTPYLVFPHGMLDPWFRKAYPLKHFKKQLYWWWREHRVLSGAASVCFTCEEERRLARSSFWPYRVNEQVVAYGTADPDGNESAQRAAWESFCPEASSGPYLLFLGRIHPKKGIKELITAYARRSASVAGMPRLVIAGPGKDDTHGREMQRLAGETCPEGSVLWPGMLSGAVKWGALRSCEAFVLTSHQENFGIAVAEAMACSRPVLISNKVNIWREIESDGAGLVNSDTNEGVESMLLAWSQMPLQARTEMGDSARRCFLRRFEIRRVAESLVDAIRLKLP